MDGNTSVESEWWLPARALVMLAEEQTHLRNLRRYVLRLHFSHCVVLDVSDVYDVYDVEDGVRVCKSMVCVGGFG